MSSFESIPPPGWSAPASPPAEAPPPDHPPKSRSPLVGAITWLLVSAIVILPMGIAYLRASGVHSSSYAIGSAFGAAFLIFLAAAAAQAVHRRVTGRVEPAPLQGFVAIAGVLAIGV